MVKFIDITRKAFLNEYKYLYRYTTIERLIEQLDTVHFTFVNPSLWADPFEKFFLERDFVVDGNKVKLPMKDSIYSVCMSRNVSSEAYWKVYAPDKNGVRLKYSMEKFIVALEKVKGCDIHIGEVKYQITQEFHNLRFDKLELAKEVEKNNIGEQQLRLLLLKRKSYSYEEEVRFMVVPETKQSNTKTFKVHMDVRPFVSDHLFDPRLEDHHFGILKKAFFSEYGIRVSHSKLYKEKVRDKIILR